MQSWERSKRDLLGWKDVTIVSQGGEDEDAKPCTTNRSEAVRKQSTGDPRYLAIALQALAVCRQVEALVDPGTNDHAEALAKAFDELRRRERETQGMNGLPAPE